MPLDPKVKAYLDQQAASGAPPRYLLLVEVARAQANQAARLAGLPETVRSVENLEIAGPGGPLKLRVYTPEGSKPFGGLLYFHGGGWVLGNLDSHDNLARSLANRGRCVVVSVEYRLAPENKFPAALEDCYAATEWVIANTAALGIAPGKVGVSGDSAGGNLAVGVCLKARDNRLPVAFQLLIYPILSYYESGLPSYRENGSGFGLSKAEMAWFFELYLSNIQEAQNPLACPLATADFTGLPPALIITAEYDPLRDEGALYAERLREAGIAAKLKEYKGMIHNFLRLGSLFDQADEALELIGGELRKTFTLNPA